MPSTSWPASTARLTTALMAGLSPGTSPPPVRIPIFTSNLPYQSLAAGDSGVFVRMVRAAHEWSGFDVLEAEREAFGLQLREFVRMVVAHDVQVSRSWAQILADGQDIDVARAQVLHRLRDLLAHLAQTNHDA